MIKVFTMTYIRIDIALENIEYSDLEWIDFEVI